MDNRTCPICRDLNGFQWIFEVGVDQFPNGLYHPAHGEVWNMAIGSAAHGDNAYMCRCHLETEFELGDILTRVTRIADELEAAVAEGDARGEGFR
jgi:hypothetical protein